MNTAKKICESDEQGVVHVDVPIGRSRQRVEVLVIWEDLGEPSEVDKGGPSMAELVGLLQEGDLTRPAQGVCETRDALA